MSYHITEADYEKFRIFLEKVSGIVLGDNKQYLITSRLNKILDELKLANFTQLMERIEKESSLREKIMDAMTTNETSWFRDGYPYEFLRNHILPEAVKLHRNRKLRIWSAACSSGQEPYSISMIFQEFVNANPGALPNDLEIIATDISPTVLQAARSGLYEGMALSRGLSDDRKKRFFLQNDDRWQVRPEIRARVTFREFNLLQNYNLLGKFDVIFCRNVLIYFSSQLKTEVLGKFSESLNPQGYLFLGGSESMSGYSEAYNMVRCPPGVAYCLKEQVSSAKKK